MSEDLPPDIPRRPKWSAGDPPRAGVRDRTPPDGFEEIEGATPPADPAPSDGVNRPEEAAGRPGAEADATPEPSASGASTGDQSDAVSPFDPLPELPPLEPYLAHLEGVAPLAPDPEVPEVEPLPPLDLPPLDALIHASSSDSLAPDGGEKGNGTLPLPFPPTEEPATNGRAEHEPDGDHDRPRLEALAPPTAYADDPGSATGPFPNIETPAGPDTVAWAIPDLDEPPAPEPEPLPIAPPARPPRPRFPPAPTERIQRARQRAAASLRALQDRPPLVAVPDLPPTGEDEEPRSPGPRPRLKKLRLLLIAVALLGLGLVSFVFGMVTAISQELGPLEHAVLTHYPHGANSEIFDDHGRLLGVLAQDNRILVTQQQIPQIMDDAVVSVEDKRFYQENGVDLKGLGRAFIEDLLHTGGVQGASTIPEQFVKNALAEQSHRTIFEKLREAALAYHLSRTWSKPKILTAYLNTVYFGNGAYGVESAARVYFGREPNMQGCGTPTNLCVGHLDPPEAALLAGMISSPSGYDPVVRRAEALQRRNYVLKDMYNQNYITQTIYDQSLATALPSPSEIREPEVSTPTPGSGYFLSWVEQLMINRYGISRTFNGGLKVRTTLDLPLQEAAESAVNDELPSGGPSAALVAIQNSTGEVKAMVGGPNYEADPFNLATQGERQPGSAFKVFDLAVALEHGISPNSEWPSEPRTFVSYNSQHERVTFHVANDEATYVGQRTLANALAYSDNSVFAAVGLSPQVGTGRIAKMAHRMGITTPISTNPAMTIGGLQVGVTPIDMAHAYETLAHGGQRVTGTFSDLKNPMEPVGIEQVTAPKGRNDPPLPDGHYTATNHVHLTRVLPQWVASTETQMLEGVIQYGTGTSAAIGGFEAGKTGTTSNYADAWFVGWDPQYTVAVWVGYPNKLVDMTSDYDGGPVMGGTYPALIWHNFMDAAAQLSSQGSGHGTNGTSTGSSSGSAVGDAGVAASGGAAGTATPPGGAGAPASTGAGSGGASPAPSAPPAQAVIPSQTPTPPAPTNTPVTPTPSATASPTSQAPSAGASGGAAAPSGGAAAPSG
ncbi:MAG TPA: transglycosylase domain-containing protein [Solirubrobacteraceae bacterium]|jgi:penicillin-binding protein 1A|nr:transglycosylase domain-containing protein [Solirubrobacteraceae bacterium]